MWSVEYVYLSSFLGFIDATGCQIGVVPATESVILIVDALSMANHDHLVSRRCRRHSDQRCCTRPSDSTMCLAPIWQIWHCFCATSIVWRHPQWRHLGFWTAGTPCSTYVTMCARKKPSEIFAYSNQSLKHNTVQVVGSEFCSWAIRYEFL